MIDCKAKKAACVMCCAAIAALFTLLLFFCAPEIATIPEATGFDVTAHKRLPDGSTQDMTLTAGKDFVSTNIIDLGELGRITKVNYVADRFVYPKSISDDMRTVDLTEPFEFAKKGTLIFVIRNLDPLAEDYNDQVKNLSKYKIGDTWQFTFALPKIFGASNVYTNSLLAARNGEIDNYDFINFNTSYDKRTEKYSAETAVSFVGLQFYTRRVSLEDTLSAAQIITVHYQSTGGAYSGIKDCPLVGTENAVKGLYQTSQDLVIAFAIVAVVVFAVLVALSAVERSTEFAAAVVWIFGIALLLLSRFFLSGSTGAPLMWTAFSLAAPFIVLGGAQFAIGSDVGKVPLKYMFPALSALGALLSLINPFVPYGAAAALRTACTAVKAVGAAALSAFIARSLFDKKATRGTLQTACAAVIAVATTASLFMPQVFPAQLNPIFWLCAATALATLVNVFIEFTEVKRSNDYLTHNLHKEVDRQVRDIKAVISDRDNLLQFVSHDMKKPLASAVMLCDTAILREKDAEQQKTLGIIKQDAQRVIDNLSEIAAYAKLNYLAEPSQIVDMSELCALLFKYHRFDCDANGIILKNTVDRSVKAFDKPKGIENVVSNIVINAIEHANCSEITISVAADKDKTVLAIADNGKGIAPDLDILKPYVSENDAETGGIGLYICKNIVESMNGELSYRSDKSGTTFYISLLKA